MKSTNPVIVSVTHHCQNPSDSTITIAVGNVLYNRMWAKMAQNLDQGRTSI
jgi:hypothetical protein